MSTSSNGKLYPNVDFYSGVIYRAIGIPVEMFTAMFAIGRLPGWIAHWLEMRRSPGKKSAARARSTTAPPSVILCRSRSGNTAQKSWPTNRFRRGVRNPFPNALFLFVDRFAPPATDAKRLTPTPLANRSEIA